MNSFWCTKTGGGCSTLVRESRYQGWTNMAND